MIPIKRANLRKLVIDHTDSIINYYASRRPFELKLINRNIKNIWGNNYSFDKIIAATPEKLREVVTIIDASNRPLPFPIKSIATAYTSFSSHKKTIFKDKTKGKYSALNFVQHLSVSVCPYCNRNYIFSLPISKRRTSQLDHFYPKDRYPFLALSFYNLIPSCTTCNHLKSNNRGTYCNPYEIADSNSLVRFEAQIKGMKFLDKVDDIELNAIYSREFKDSYLNFRFSELYSNHRDLVQDLFKKKYIYNDVYLDALFKQFEGKLLKNKEELVTLILSNYISEDDLQSRPFSKLTMDIWHQIQNSTLLPKL